MPLVWAHAEYLTLLRSVAEGRPFDEIPQIVERYQTPRERPVLEIWKFNRHAPRVPVGGTLRVQAPGSFMLHWSDDGWQTVHDTPSHSTALGIDFVDLPARAAAGSAFRFTFFWNRDARWEGRDFSVPIV